MDKHKLIVISAVLLLPIWACTQSYGPWEDWIRQRQKEWKEFRLDSLGKSGEGWRILPDSSGFFYFRIDTSFSQLPDEWHRFFRFGPEDKDLLFPPELRSFDQMFERFFRDMPKPGLIPEMPDFPADDGGRREEDLLPEERLRQQEKQPPVEQLDKNKSKEQTPAPKQKAPDVKTIRI